MGRIIQSRGIQIVLATLLLTGCGKATTSPAPEPTQTTFGLESPVYNRDCQLQLSSETRPQLVVSPRFEPTALNFPVGMVQAPGDDDHYFLWQQDGKILRMSAANPAAAPFVFANFNSILQDPSQGNGETGLLGFSFHPDFPADPRVFIVYTAKTVMGEFCQRPRISSFAVNPATQNVDPASETVLMTDEQTCEHHYGGTLGFGPDGYLYISWGDHLNSATAQDLSNLAGSMLRIDVNNGVPYQVPADNPFVGTSGAAGEIYAYGFRNPWKWSFDRANGDLWLADVGQATWEEIDRIESGGNYGWPITEGEECYLGPCNTTGILAPVAVYSHDEGCSVTGGYVYRGSAIPALAGTYLYADYCRGTVWGLKTESGGEADAPQVLLETGRNLVSFAENNAGELDLIDREGAILHIDDLIETTVLLPPERLSETGCFQSLRPTVAADGLIGYDVNVPFWSDGAVKDRWMALPEGSHIQLGEAGHWELPAGSILIKNFSLNGRKIETRFLVQHDAGQWSGYSYRWNTTQNDAILVPEDGLDEFYGKSLWSFPSRSACLFCHNDANGYALGLENAQMNKPFLYLPADVESNQIETLAHVGLLADPSGMTLDPLVLDAFPMIQDITPESPQLDAAARAYLHVNCAICHRPGGPGVGPPDFRYGIPLSQMGICNVTPSQGDLAIAGGKILIPGHPGQSILWQRMQSLGEERMPPIASHQVDQLGVDLIFNWIRSIQSCD